MREPVRMPDTKIDLSKIPLFAGVDTSAFGGDIADWLYFHYDGQSICVEGEPTDSMIVILQAAVAIVSQDDFLVTRRAPDVLGEQGFLAPDACRTASAIARGTVQVLRI